MATSKTSEINKLVSLLGFDQEGQQRLFKDRLTRLMNSAVTASSMKEFGRFDELKKCVDLQKAKAYFEKEGNETLAVFKVNMKIATLLEDFILQGGFDV